MMLMRVEQYGTAFFERVCKLELEGIVAKHSLGNYVVERERTTWFKIKNRNYSQMAGREKLFERERHRQPVPGWHTCDLACADVWIASKLIVCCCVLPLCIRPDYSRMSSSEVGQDVYDAIRCSPIPRTKCTVLARKGQAVRSPSPEGSAARPDQPKCDLNLPAYPPRRRHCGAAVGAPSGPSRKR